jgi:hypothetical protein
LGGVLKSIGKRDLLITCAEPTLLRGTRTFTAAMLVPPSATSSATQATIRAGEGLGNLPSTRYLLYWVARILFRMKRAIPLQKAPGGARPAPPG